MCEVCECVCVREREIHIVESIQWVDKYCRFIVCKFQLMLFTNYLIQSIKPQAIVSISSCFCFHYPYFIVLAIFPEK